jgi:transposase
MADKTGEAAQYLDWYGKLYKIEDNIRKAGLNPEKIREHRQEHSKPIMDEMKAWLDVKSLLILPESPLGKAISYSLSNWEKLILFLDNGLIPIDNNMPENAIRPFVIGRKNWLFNANDRGAEASAGFYTLIETAKANGLDPYWYFRMLFTRYPKCASLEEMEKLLPMNVTPEDLKNFEKECASEL